jgi:hypothetical protein
VAAVLDPETRNQRLPAWNTPFTWNDVLDVMRKEYPDRQFMDELPDMGRINLTTDSSVSERLIKAWSDRSDWISLEDSVVESLVGVA